jgi:hypothetical protein
MYTHEMPTMITSRNESDGSLVADTVLRGTMLPSMPNPKGREDEHGFFSPNLDKRLGDHSTTRSWKVQGGGSVVLPTAVVAASNVIPVEAAYLSTTLADTWRNDP